MKDDLNTEIDKDKLIIFMPSKYNFIQKPKYRMCDTSKPNTTTTITKDVERVPLIDVTLINSDGKKINVVALIDTGCTHCILQEELAKEFIQDFDESDGGVTEIQGAGGKGEIKELGLVRVHIPNHHKTESSIGIILNAGGGLDDAMEKGGFGLVLGMEFIQKCVEFTVCEDLFFLTIER